MNVDENYSIYLLKFHIIHIIIYLKIPSKMRSNLELLSRRAQTNDFKTVLHTLAQSVEKGSIEPPSYNLAPLVFWV